MKKLSSINWISFKEDNVYLEDVPITVGLNIEKWLEDNSTLQYITEIAEYNKKRKYLEFVNYSFIIISIYDKIIDKISVFPFEYQNSPYFKGDIFIFDKKLEVPFLSDDIEQYFPEISIKPKGYFKRFSPRETIDYIISNELQIEISIGRDPEFVSSFSLKNR
jgi:hypothetical protein